MSQPALNVTMREIHLQLRTLGEDLYDAGRLRVDTPERLRLWYARSALSARAAAAASRLGTDKPSELAVPSVVSRPAPMPIAPSSRRGAASAARPLLCRQQGRLPGDRR
jgi:hypothetical protein